MGPWVAGRLLIFDKGYCCYTLFGKIHENEGYFLTRLKDHCNPTIRKVHSAVRVNPALLRGRPLRIAVNDLRRETFDATVEIYFPRLLTSGKRKFTKGFYRLIGLYDTDKSKYHFYMTNIPAELLAAEDAYNVYRVRWEIELIFKELKSGYGLGGITSCSKHVVTALIYSAVITLIVSRKLFRSIASHLGSRAERATGSRWCRLFATHANDLLFAVTRQSRENAATRELLQLLVHEMVDPHLGRKSLLSQDARPTKKKRRGRRRRLASQT